MARILSFQDIKNLDIPVGDILDSVQQALIEHSKGNVYLLPKVTIRPSEDTFYTAMPGGVRKWGYMGNKTIQRVSDPQNGPSIKGSMFLNDQHTGDLLAVMDATWLTSMRTGAVAALAAKHLAKSQVNKIALMGLGNTATATLLCLKHLFPDLREVVILNYKDHAQRISARFPSINFSVVDEVKDLFDGTDIVITSLTYAGKPFVQPEWLSAGLLAIPIHMRGWQDCDVFFDKVFTDDHSHIKSWMPTVDGELGAVMNGTCVGRSNDSEKIIAYNYGIAIDDIAVAKVIYEIAEKKNAGKIIEIEDFDEKYYI